MPGAQKQDQRSGTLTEGMVSEILTKSATHSHGIKVRLTDGEFPVCGQTAPGGWEVLEVAREVAI